MDRVRYSDRMDNRPGMDRTKRVAKYLFDKACANCNRRPAGGSWMPDKLTAIRGGLEPGTIIPMCPGCLHFGFDPDYVMGVVKHCGVQVELPEENL